jgi:hypothetical protein
MLAFADMADVGVQHFPTSPFIPPHEPRRWRRDELRCRVNKGHTRRHQQRHTVTLSIAGRGIAFALTLSMLMPFVPVLITPVLARRERWRAIAIAGELAEFQFDPDQVGAAVRA